MRTFKEMEAEFYRNVRAELLDGLEQCTAGQRGKFKQMYANGKTELAIDVVVGRMAKGKLDWAMQQTARTIELNAKKAAGEA